MVEKNFFAERPPAGGYYAPSFTELSEIIADMGVCLSVFRRGEKFQCTAIMPNGITHTGEPQQKLADAAAALLLLINQEKQK